MDDRMDVEDGRRVAQRTNDVPVLEARCATALYIQRSEERLWPPPVPRLSHAPMRLVAPEKQRHAEDLSKMAHPDARCRQSSIGWSKQVEVVTQVDECICCVRSFVTPD
ncbi:hypothetical protein Tcan_14919 [Toxocara canis]|uniref:Uncharacterized protein n=2 Tax=Toxocara canis TaxID=6265 RepID=A0A0B2V544_TOXCA|nr:hypothetical protein Tcan_14919 [Toxocara canis]VDM27741.1 unnamed protein product [Toxocara canis]